MAIAHSSDRKTLPNREFDRGWQIVLAAMLGIGLGLSPMPFYTIGMFAPYFAREFGWSFGDIMGGITVTTLMVLWAGPVVGLLAIRFGVRKVALTSLVLFGLAFMAMGLSNGSLKRYYLTWAVIAIVGAGTLPITWTRAVNHWFDVHRGLALGLSLLGTGLFGIFSKPYVAWLIAHYGWRFAYVGLGLLPLLIAFPTAFILFRDTDTHAETVVRDTVPGGLTMAQALRDWRFWLLAVALVPISFCLSGPVPNLETILKNDGVLPDTIIRLTPLIGLSAIIGRLVGGWLMDRCWAPAVGFLILSMPAISCWLLAGGPLPYATAAAAIFLIGFALGVEYDLMAFLVARYFGLRSYTAIYGVLYVSFSLGAGLGPLGFGKFYDLHHNFHFAMIAAALVLVLSAAPIMLLGRYRTFADDPMVA